MHCKHPVVLRVGINVTANTECEAAVCDHRCSGPQLTSNKDNQTQINTRIYKMLVKASHNPEDTNMTLHLWHSTPPTAFRFSHVISFEHLCDGSRLKGWRSRSTYGKAPVCLFRPAEKNIEAKQKLMRSNLSQQLSSDCPWSHLLQRSSSVAGSTALWTNCPVWMFGIFWISVNVEERQAERRPEFNKLLLGKIK